MDDFIYQDKNIKSLKITSEMNFKDVIDKQKEFSKQYDNEDLLLIYDQGYDTIFSPDQMEKIISFIDKNILNRVDIFYLSNYMDDLNKAENINTREDIYNLKFYRSFSPNGINCAISTFKGWDKIFNITKLNKNYKENFSLINSITSSQIKAASSWPRIFFPKLNLNNDNKSFIFNDWKENDTFGRKIPNTHKYSLAWFIFTCIISSVVIYYIHKKIPVNRFFKVNDKNKVIII